MDGVKRTVPDSFLDPIGAEMTDECGPHSYGRDDIQDCPRKLHTTPT